MVKTLSERLASSLHSKLPATQTGFIKVHNVMIPVFHDENARAILNARFCLSSSSCARQEPKFRSYGKVIICLMALYAAENMIANSERDILNFNHSSSQRAFEFMQALWTRAPVFSTTNIVSRENSLDGLDHQSKNVSEATGLGTSQPSYKHSEITRYPLQIYSWASQHWNKDSQHQDCQKCATIMLTTSWI